MSERFEANIDLGNGKVLEIEVDRKNDIGILLDDDDDIAQACISHVKAREIAKALLTAANYAESMIISKAKEAKS